MPQKYKKAMIFGVFDCFHPGHKSFIDQAIQKCQELVVVLTPSETVLELKKKASKFSFEKRLADLQAEFPHLAIVEGDRALGTWNIFQKQKPDIVFLGHDQHQLAEELKKMNIPFAHLEAHKPEIYKSSLLR